MHVLSVPWLQVLNGSFHGIKDECGHVCWFPEGMLVPYKLLRKDIHQSGIEKPTRFNIWIVSLLSWSYYLMNNINHALHEKLYFEWKLIISTIRCSLFLHRNTDKIMYWKIFCMIKVHEKDSTAFGRWYLQKNSKSTPSGFEKQAVIWVFIRKTSELESKHIYLFLCRGWNKH